MSAKFIRVWRTNIDRAFDESERYSLHVEHEEAE